MPYKNIEDRRKQQREWKREWLQNPENHRKQIKAQRKWREKNLEKARKWSREKARKEHLVMILEMGGKCEKCGYHEFLCALEIHHLNGIEIKTQRLQEFYYWRRTGKLPKDTILFCANCHRVEHS